MAGDDLGYSDPALAEENDVPAVRQVAPERHVWVVLDMLAVGAGARQRLFKDSVEAILHPGSDGSDR